MTLSVENISPAINSDIGIENNIEFDIIGKVDLATVNIEIKVGTIAYDFAVLNGQLRPNYILNSEIHTLIDSSGYHFSLKQDYEWQDQGLGTEIIVRINARDLDNVQMPEFTYSMFTRDQFIGTFEVEQYDISDPDSWSYNTNMTALPTGFITQSSGTGSPPSFETLVPKGMKTHPGLNGTSYIINSSSGLDFDAGVTIELQISAAYTSASNKKAKVLKLVKNGQGIISVNIDFDNHELWLSDINDELLSGSRSIFKYDEIKFRLTIKGSGSNLIARLYFNSGINSTYVPLLKESGKTSTPLPVSGDDIIIGSIDTGDADFLFKKYSILLNSDPDLLHPTPIIKSISPNNGFTTGNEDYVLSLKDNIDVNMGSDSFDSLEEILDVSSGNGSIIASNGILSLILNGIGEAHAKLTKSYNGDIVNGVDISVDINIDQTLVLTPPNNEVILFGMEIISRGSTTNFEFVSNTSNGAHYRILSKLNNTQQLNINAGNSLSNFLTCRIVKFKSQIYIIVNGVLLNKLNVKDGINIVGFYTQSQGPIFTTTISNMVVYPITIFGEEVGGL